MEFKKVLSAATVAVAFGLSAFAAQAANDVTLKVVGTMHVRRPCLMAAL